MKAEMRSWPPARIRRAAGWRFRCIAAAIGFLAIAAPNPTWAGQPVVKFGVDPRYSPREMFERYQPLLDHLQQTTGHRFELHLTKTYEEGIRDLGSGVTGGSVRSSVASAARPMDSTGPRSSRERSGASRICGIFEAEASPLVPGCLHRAIFSPGRCWSERGSVCPN